jgi:hypothetical protein
MTMNSEVGPALTERECREWLSRLLMEAQEEAFEGTERIARIVSFEEAGLLTSTEGLVIRLTDGSEFQVSIRRSR